MLYPLQRTRQIALAIKGLAPSQLEVAFVVLEPVMAKRLDRYGVILRDGRLPEKMLGG
jgi:predicted RNA polymerase sigma factor